VIRRWPFGDPDLQPVSDGDWQRNGQWIEAAREMATVLERLHLAGADFGLIATNTMHFVFDEVQRAVHMPLLSIVDATVEAILAAGLRSVGLLGTVFPSVPI